ncbi:MAG: hypothetical protein K6A34_06110 [Methanobrevibacter sp.]|nr:hypothetical protein [Methanobrevibacter sp.]
MATLEDIMLTISATDDASNVFKNVGSTAQSMASNATQAINSMNSGLMNLSNVSNNLFSKLSQGKSASDLLLGTTSKAETNAVLVKLMTQSSESAAKLNQHIDNVTNTSLVSMQSLIPAMNAFKSATGATDDQIYNATEGIAQFGAKVLAQTGSVELAEQAMMNLSKGIKGAFASLDQYGISEDALMRTGLWSGKEDDIEGYIAAIQKCTGDTSALMETNEGLDARLGKAFSSAGKKIGNEFLPQIKEVKKAFLDLNSATGGNLAAGIIVAAEGIDMFSQSMMVVGQTSQGIRGIVDGFSAAKTAISTATDWLNKFRAAEEAATAVSTVSAITPGDAMNMAAGGNILGGATSKGTTAVVKETEEIVEAGAPLKTIGPQAAAEGVMAEEAAVGMQSFSAGVMSMLVPLLEIAVVIAIMIPVVTAIAAEALLCIKGIQLLVDALDFGGVDLDDDIKGIKQTGEALLQIGIAMGEMTFASIMTGANLWVTGLFMIVNPIQVAVNQLKTVIPIVNELSAVGTIDKSIPGKLKAFSDSMKLVSDAMNTMTEVTGVTAFAGFIAWVAGLGTVTSAIKKAKEDIATAAKEISEFSNLPEIDKGVVTKLKSTSDSLKSVADAMKSLQDLNWTEITGNLFGNTDVIHTLKDAKQDIVDAATALSEFTDLPEIPKGVATKLKAVADSLKSVKDATSALADINWAEWTGNLFGNTDFVGSLRSAKNDIEGASREVASLNNLPEIPKGVAGKLKSVTDTLKVIPNVISSLGDINWMEWTGNLFGNTDFVGSLRSAKNDIEGASREIATLNNIPDVPGGTTTKVTRIADATKMVANVISQMQNANFPNIVSLAILPVRINTARGVLQNTANQLLQLQGIPQVPEGLSAKLTTMSTVTTTMGRAVSSINTVPFIGPEASLKVQMAVSAIKKSVTELNKLNGSNVNNVSGVLASVRNTMNQLRATLASMRGSFAASSVGIGAGIKAGVIQGMSGLSGEVNAQATSAMAVFNATMTTGGTTAGNSARTAFQSSFKLSDIARAEMNFAVQAVNSGSGALAEACRRAAEQAVQAARDGAESHSPGAVARMWGQEIGEYSVEKVKSGAALLVRTVRNISRDVVNAWGSPSLDIGNNLGMLSSFNPGSLRNMNMLSQVMPSMGNSNKTIIFNVQKGAWQLDARNLTERECQKIVTLGLESLTQVSDVNIRGI